MVALKPRSKYGHAPPPATPYSILSNFPGWELNRRTRDGDIPAQMATLEHIYPRFGPTHYVVKLGEKIAEKLGHEGKQVFGSLNPDFWAYVLRYITSKHRDDFATKPDDIIARCVEVAGHRIYVILFDPVHGLELNRIWQNAGVGLSIRGAEMLLGGIASFKEVPCQPFSDIAPPAPTWTPESSAHQHIRERIVKLLHRATINPNVVCTPKDVYLYPTGMASIFHTANTLVAHRPGTIVVAGIIFFNEHLYLHEEAQHGFKHQGHVSPSGLDELEIWLEGEVAQGRPVSFLITEFPGNTTLEAPDLPRLKKLSEKFDFVLIIDDTVSSFANVDIFAHADILITSLTKGFSGYSNVLAGSAVLNPQSKHYTTLTTLFASHHNELFTRDAEILLANSESMLERTRIWNDNAQAMVDFLQRAADDPSTPILAVQYPSQVPWSEANYNALKRQPSSDLPEPGYGCLFTVNFDSVESAAAFFDNCGFYPSPHFAAPVTVIFPFNMMCYGPTSEYYSPLGVRQESVRISAGFEAEEDLIDTLKVALQAAVAVKDSRPSASI